MELSAVTHELYGLPLKEFTTARDQRVAEARRAGDRDLAESVKRLRKPSTAAWVTNVLARDQQKEIRRLIERGAALRSARNPDGARIRQATRDKSEMVTKLLRRARSIATRAALPLSKSVEQEIEATLDAAFSDADSARSLSEGCLTTTLHYSGLGFGADAEVRGPTARSRGSARANTQSAKAEHDLDHARSEAERAAAEVEGARRAVRAAEADLHRLRTALTVATRRETRAKEKVAHAQEKLDRVRSHTR